MTKRKLKIAVVCLTFIAILLSKAAPNWVSEYGDILSVSLIFLLGVPHGATDHILFKHTKSSNLKGWVVRFFTQYFLMIAAFTVVWIFFPVLALAFFLGISAYHFGQSQWHFLSINKIEKTAIYILWGGFVLAAPILWNFTETAPILEELTKSTIALKSDYQLFLPFITLLSVICLILFLYAKKEISAQRVQKELGILMLLTLLFYTTPLLVGFTVYFVFWHSIDSVIDQIEKLKSVQQDYNFPKYILQVTPFTIGAFLGIAAFSYFTPAAILSVAWIGQMFILISVVTLPHSLLMDAFLEEEISTDKTTNNRASAVKKTLPLESVPTI